MYVYMYRTLSLIITDGLHMVCHGTIIAPGGTSCVCMWFMCNDDIVCVCVGGCVGDVWIDGCVMVGVTGEII